LKAFGEGQKAGSQRLITVLTPLTRSIHDVLDILDGMDILDGLDILASSSFPFNKPLR
jgi:hypothetical protein